MRITRLAVTLLLLTTGHAEGATETTLLLETEPPGAAVELDGETVGKTPIRLQFPSAYFKERHFAWAKHLPDPLHVVFRREGFETREVDLGTAKRFVALNPISNFKYYMLEERYSFVLTPKSTHSSTSRLETLERLADLRDRGALDEEEFQRLKDELLAVADEGPSQSLPPGVNVTRGEVQAATFEFPIPKEALAGQPDIPTPNHTIDGTVGIRSIRFTSDLINDKQSGTLTAEFKVQATHTASVDFEVQLVGPNGRLGDALQSQIVFSPKPATPDTQTLKSTWRLPTFKLREWTLKEELLVLLTMKHRMWQPESSP